MKLLESNLNNIKIAAEALKEGKLVGFPTETVYGVGAIYNDINAYKALNALKRRSPDKPYTLMLYSVNDINKYAYVDEKIMKFLSKEMPGEITVILKAKKLPNHIMNNASTIGIRIPKCDITLELLKEVGIPLLVPSLNRSGDTPLSNPNDIKKEFDNELEYLLLGEIKDNVPSTVISLCDNIKVIREGKVPSKKLIEEYNKL